MIYLSKIKIQTQKKSINPKNPESKPKKKLVLWVEGATPIQPTANSRHILPTHPIIFQYRNQQI
jgi:hypothetical protein